MVNYWMCLLMDFKAVGRAVFLGKERAEQFVNRERSWCLARLQRGVLGPPGHMGGAGVQPGTWLQVVSSLRLLWVFLWEGKRYPLRGFCVEIVHLIKHQGWKTEVCFFVSISIMRNVFKHSSNPLAFCKFPIQFSACLLLGHWELDFHLDSTVETGFIYRFPV